MKKNNYNEGVVKMKKKILLGFLVIVGLLTITGCGKNSNNNSNVKSSKEYILMGYHLN